MTGPIPFRRRDDDVMVRVPLSLVQRRGLSDTAKVLWMVVRGLGGPIGSVETTSARLAAAMGLSSRQVERLIAELRAAGLLAVEAHPGRPSRYAAVEPEDGS